MKIVVSERAEAYLKAQGGKVWVWLDPRRGLVGSYVWLEAHPEPPGASKRSGFTRSSKRPHRFKQVQDGWLEVNYDFGRLDLPEELHFDLKGWKGRRRLEAYWNGCVFVGEDILTQDQQQAWRAPGPSRKT